MRAVGIFEEVDSFGTDIARGDCQGLWDGQGTSGAARRCGTVFYLSASEDGPLLLGEARWFEERVG